MEDAVEDVTEEVQEIVDVDPNDDLFDDGETPIEKGEVVPETPSEEVIVEKVDEEPVTTTEPEETPQEQVVESKEVLGLKAALAAERAKRQALEQVSQPKTPIEFDWDNPNETIQALKSDIEAKTNERFISMSEAQAKSRYDDYDEKYAVFVEMAQENPSIVDEVVKQVDPAEYAYQLAKKKQFTDSIGSNPDEYRARLEAEIRAKIGLENKTKAENDTALRASIPPSAKSLGDKVTPATILTNPDDDLFDDHPSG